MAAPGKPRQIRIQYVKPVNPAHQPILDELKRARGLERMQALLAPIRLPRPLLLKLDSCDGDANAWYDEGEIVVCYEYVAEIMKIAPEKVPPIGITKLDTIVGPLIDTVLHEAGHAVFDLLKIPVFGREEDAADLLSAYIMLKLGQSEARRLIIGTAYQYRTDIQNPSVTMDVKSFSDVHGLPAQRFYNVLCIAYGADKKLFADVVEQGYLPKDRAESCDDEYKQVDLAYRKLLMPHVDASLRKKPSAIGAGCRGNNDLAPGDPCRCWQRGVRNRGHSRIRVGDVSVSGHAGRELLRFDRSVVAFRRRKLSTSRKVAMVLGGVDFHGLPFPWISSEPEEHCDQNL